jgi:hypothetical protein
MKKLYQTFKHLLKTRPLKNPEFVMLQCPDFLMKIILDKSSVHSEKHFCYMDTYQHQQINVLKQIGIKEYTTQDI